jgi:hypothetical protein
MREHLAEVAHVDVGFADRAIAEMIGLGFDRCRDNSEFPSSIPRQLPASPMLVFPVAVEHALDVTV